MPVKSRRREILVVQKRDPYNGDAFITPLMTRNPYNGYIGVDDHALLLVVFFMVLVVLLTFTVVDFLRQM